MQKPRIIPDDYVFFLDYSNQHSFLVLLDSLQNLPLSYYYGHAILIVLHCLTSLYLTLDRYLPWDDDHNLHAVDSEYLNVITTQYPFLQVLYTVCKFHSFLRVISLSQSNDSSTLTHKVAGLLFNADHKQPQLRLWILDIIQLYL